MFLFWLQMQVTRWCIHSE